MTNGNGNFEDIREILRRIAENQARHEAALPRHAEMMVKHDQRMAAHDERMDRVGRHLEVLAEMCAEGRRNNR